jgi:hypothetical protein
VAEAPSFQLHHHTHHPFVVASALISAVAFFIVAFGYPAEAVSYTTYKHPTHEYAFQYPGAWSVTKGSKSVAINPPKADISQLKSKGITYSLTTTYLNADTTTFTPTLKNALGTGWTKFLSAYNKTLKQKHGVTPTVKTLSKKNWLVSEMTVKKKVNNVATVWRFVVMTRDKKRVFVVNEKWTKSTTSPYATEVTMLVKSLTHYTPPLVTWSFDGSAWKASSTPPACPNPFTVTLPIDITKASSTLYPGQVRGGQYKPHGGFRLDGTAYNAVTITAPFDAYIVDGSRHYEQGEVQMYFDFIHPCGIRYRLDHLHTLSSTMQVFADQLPPPTVGSQSYVIKPTLIKAGTVIATAVGHPDNVGFDLGVYDLRQRNAASQSETFRTARADMMSNAYYAVCWFDWLSATEETAVRALPPGDGVSGATSDYCL